MATDKTDHQPAFRLTRKSQCTQTAIKSAALVILMTGWGIAANDRLSGSGNSTLRKSQTAGQWVKVEDLGSNRYPFDNGSICGNTRG